MAYLTLRILDTASTRELKIQAEAEAKRRGYKGLGALIVESLSKELAEAQKSK